jgi:hypothetical protein
MNAPSTRRLVTCAAAIALAAFMPILVAAQQPSAGNPPATSAATPNPAPGVRVRGVIQSVLPDGIVVKTRAGEERRIALAPGLTVNEVYPIDFEQVHTGSYIGVAAQPDGKGALRAIAVTVFPESARGTAEGHRPFDLTPRSTMTNATVTEVNAHVTSESEGRQLHVRYPGGEQTIVVPQGAPIVSFRTSDRSLLVPGASVSMLAREAGGGMTAERVNAGKGGFAILY